jgi:hypothetical protein
MFPDHGRRGRRCKEGDERTGRVCDGIDASSADCPAPDENRGQYGSAITNRHRSHHGHLPVRRRWLLSVRANDLPGSPGSRAAEKGKAVATHASGTFDVKISPQPPQDNVGDPTVGRMSLDKQFHGDLEANSKGQMLAAVTDVKDSAGYVAIERVNGTLHGRSGTFALQHNGIMTRGEPQLTVTVVPDSGTGQLVGLAGSMSIAIVDGKHSYGFDYTLPQSTP